MGFLISIWDGIKGGLEFVLRFYEGLLEPFVGEAAWGLAIILLTVTVRIFMIPLMVRQTKSMRSMQTIQPELKKIQEKYKADRSMMKTDPERYKKIKEKQREAQMELYQEHGVNPVGGCLPLLLQMPVFLALFQVLQGGSLAEDLGGASFLGIPSLTAKASELVSGGAGGVVITAALAATVLIVMQVGTTYWSQKQMMARNTNAAAGDQAQVQKIMLYIMPVFLGYLSFTFPIGVVLYWVTTNLWTMGQQAIIFRQVEAQEVKKADERDAAKDAAKKDKAQRKDGDVSPDDAAGPRAADKTGSKGGKGGKPSSSGGSGPGAKGAGAKGAGNRASSTKGSSAKGSSAKATGRQASATKGSSAKGSGAEAEDDGASGNGRKTPRSGRPPGSGRPGKSPVQGGASKDDSNGNGSKDATAAGEDGARSTRRSTRRSRAPQDGIEGGTTARNGRPATSGGSAGSPPGNRARPRGNRSKPGSAR